LISALDSQVAVRGVTRQRSSAGGGPLCAGERVLDERPLNAREETGIGGPALRRWSPTDVA
jgi:hypothetical protein